MSRQPSEKEGLATDMAPDPMHALVVDDDPAALGVISGMPKSLGYRVDTAGGGVQAMELWNRNRYGIVVSDMQMPLLDGFALACWIKRKANHTRVIIMTGQPESTVNRYMNTRVADGWLFKPFGKDEFRDLLQKSPVTSPYYRT